MNSVTGKGKPQPMSSEQVTQEHESRVVKVQRNRRTGEIREILEDGSVITYQNEAEYSQVRGTIPKSRLDSSATRLKTDRFKTDRFRAIGQ